LSDISQREAKTKTVPPRKKQRNEKIDETKTARRRWSKVELEKLEDAVKLVGPDPNKIHKISPFDLRSSSSIRHKLGDLGYVQDTSQDTTTRPKLGGNGQVLESMKRNVPQAAPGRSQIEDLENEPCDLDDDMEDFNRESTPKDFLEDLELENGEDEFDAPTTFNGPITQKIPKKSNGYQVKSLLKGSEQTIGTQAVMGVKIPPIVMTNEDYLFVLFPKIDQVVWTFKVQEQYILVNALLTGLESTKVDGFIDKYLSGEKKESVINAFKENFHTEFYIKTPKKVDTSFCERIIDTHIEGIKAKFKKHQIIL
jgi:hypothetical protein